MYIRLISGILLLISLPSFGQKEEKVRYFLAYEFGEMAFNKFQNFAGEAWVKFKNGHLLRWVYMDVKLTEKHLFSGFANVVSGKNIEGHFKGHELFYDVPVFKGAYTRPPATQRRAQCFIIFYQVIAGFRFIPSPKFPGLSPGHT